MAIPHGDEPALRVTVYSKSYGLRTIVGAPLEVRVTPRAGEASGDAEIVVDGDDPAVPDLTADGARVTIEYTYDDELPPKLVLSGIVEEDQGEGPDESSVKRFRVIDDKAAVFNDLICWPNPTGTILQQGAESAYFKRSGSAEFVVKEIIAPNAAREGIALTIPAVVGAGLGATIAASMRMHTPTERLYPQLEHAGVEFRVLQQGTTRILDCWVPTTHPLVLTEASGIVLGGTYKRRLPLVSSVVIMAGGEGTARVMREFTDNTLELKYGVAGKRFVRQVVADARDVEVADPNLEAVLAQRAAVVLAEGGPIASLAVVLDEVDVWRYGMHYDIGDTVAIQIADGPVITDKIREIPIEWTPEGGLIITPVVGGWQDSDDDQLYRTVSQIQRSVRNIQRSR